MSDTWDPELLQWRSAGKRVIASVKLARDGATALALAEANLAYCLGLSTDFTGGLPAAYTTRYLAPGVVTRQYWPGVGFTRPEGERFGLLRTNVWGFLLAGRAGDVDVTIEHIDGDRYNFDCYEYAKPVVSRLSSSQFFSCSHETYVDEDWDGQRIAAAATVTNIGSSGDLPFAQLFTVVTWEPLS